MRQGLFHADLKGIGVFVVLAAMLGSGIGLTSVWAPAGTLAFAITVAIVFWTRPSLPQLRTLYDLWFRMHWWQVLWLALLLSSLVLRVRSTTAIGDNALDAAASYRVLLVGAVGFVMLAMLAVRQTDVFPIVGRGIFVPLMLFSLVQILSTVWSVNQKWTLYKSIEFGVDSLLAAMIVARLRTIEEYKRLFDWTWLLTGLLLLSVLIGVVLAPGQAIVRGLGTLGFSVEGIYPRISRNGIGQLAAILMVVALSRLVTLSENRRFYIGLIAITASVLIVSQTRSAIVAAVVAVPLILLAAGKLAWTSAIPVAMVALMAATNLTDTLWDYLLRNQTTQNFTTLSSRSIWWTYAWESLRRRPLTGFGAYAGGRFEVSQGFSEYLSSTHNTFIEVLVGTSLWGVIPLLLILAALWFYLVRTVVFHLGSRRQASLERTLAIEAIGVLTVLTVRSLFTVTMVWHPALEFLAIVAYAEFLRRRRTLVSSRAVVPSA